MSKMESKVGLTACCALALLLQGCGTSTGNPEVTLDQSSYTLAALPAAGPFARMWERLVPSAWASVTSVQICFKRVRFKAGSQTEDEDNLDFSIGEKNLSSGGSTLGTLNVPTGVYQRIEIDISRENNCPSGKSVSLVNDHGSFATQDGMTLRFAGSIVHDRQQSVALNLQPLITAWNAVTSAGQIKDQAESVGGSFDDE